MIRLNSILDFLVTVSLIVFLHVSTDLKLNELSLPKFQQFLMTLMKLRLNLGNQDLAYRFGISQSTVSKYFQKWINVMYIRLQPVIRWPSHEELYATMPTDFNSLPGKVGQCDRCRSDMGTTAI